jgi:hypothetical protein
MTTITDPGSNWPTLPGGDLALTTARWRNRRRRVQGGYESKGQNYDKWRKVLAHQGGYEQFSYGTDTEAGTQPSRNDGPTQRAIIGSPQSGVIHVDVDD